MGALSRGGMIFRGRRRLPVAARVAARKNDPGRAGGVVRKLMKLAERVERLADSDAQKNHPRRRGANTMRAGLYYLMAERMASHKDRAG